MLMLVVMIVILVSMGNPTGRSLSLVRHCRVFFPIKVWLAVDRTTIHRRPLNMPTERKPDLINKLQAMGEAVSDSWTVPQLKARLAELKDLNTPDEVKTLKSEMVNLNRASKKKASLVEYARNLDVNVRDTDTMSRIFAKCEEKLGRMIAPCQNDLVNFGKHADRTYQSLKENCPEYAKWVKQTAAEDPESNWRLKRLASWLNQEELTVRPGSKPGYPTSSQDMSPKPSRGKILQAFSSPSEASSKSFQMIQSEVADSEKAQLIEELAQLRAENDSLQLQMSRSKSRKET